MQPLAERIRPQTFDDYVGQKHLIGEKAILRQIIESGLIASFMLWGTLTVGKNLQIRNQLSDHMNY